MQNPLAGHTNSYHSYSFDEALQGIAEAGYKGVELSAVPGWTDHVDLDAPVGDVRAKLASYGLTAVSLSGHSDLTTAEGLAHGVKAVRWAADYGLAIVNTAIGGHWSEDEDESADDDSVLAEGFLNHGRHRNTRRRRLTFQPFNDADPVGGRTVLAHLPFAVPSCDGNLDAHDCSHHLIDELGGCIGHCPRSIPVSFVLVCERFHMRSHPR